MQPCAPLSSAFGRTIGCPYHRRFLSRVTLYSLLSHPGFVKIRVLHIDFVYAPLNTPLIWFLRNLSRCLRIWRSSSASPGLFSSMEKNGHDPGHGRRSLCASRQSFDAPCRS